MNSTRPKKKCLVPLALAWSHCGVAHRVTAWPEARFERLYGEDWLAESPSDEALASAASELGVSEWRVYLDFVPREVRYFIDRFRCGHMEALQVVARCPALLPVLEDTPALTAFIAAHASLRGSRLPSWEEINALFERSGVYGVLEWLGLPSSRQTLAILRNVAEPNLPKRFLEPLRTLLWEPRTIFALQRTSAITDRQLARFCHALAA